MTIEDRPLARELSDRIEALEAAERAWRVERAALIRSRGRSLALAVALRAVRAAETVGALLAAIEDVLIEQVGAEGFAIVQDACDGVRILVSHGLAGDDIAEPPLARFALGVGDLSLGSLVIYRLARSKAKLDVFDHDLLEAVAAQTAVALHASRVAASRPTSRPPAMRPPEGT